MEDWEIKMRNELALKFQETVPWHATTDPLLDENGKDMTHPLYGKAVLKKTKKKLSAKMTGNTNKAGTKVKDTSNMKKPGVHNGSGNPNWKGGVCKDMKKYKAEYYQRRKAA